MKFTFDGVIKRVYKLNGQHILEILVPPTVPPVLEGLEVNEQTQLQFTALRQRSTWYSWHHTFAIPIREADVEEARRFQHMLCEIRMEGIVDEPTG